MSHYRVSAAQHSNLSNAWLPVALALEDQFEISPRDGEGALESVKSHLSLVSLDFFLEMRSVVESNSCSLSLDIEFVSWPWEIRVSAPQVVLLHLEILLSHLSLVLSLAFHQISYSYKTSFHRFDSIHFVPSTW